MSAIKSNLSDFGYDLVVGVTQGTVNYNMEQWLKYYQGDPFTQVYVGDKDNKKTILSDYSQLKSQLGFDPFEVPNNTPATNPQIKKLKDINFKYAFQVHIGLPPIPPFLLGDVKETLLFDQAGTAVTYNLSCKTFKVLELQQVKDQTAKWINLSQFDIPESGKRPMPWTFQFKVNLKLRTDDKDDKFSKLPATTQKAIENLGKDMFSVQQLFLDLNTAELSDSPVLKGVSGTAHEILTKSFIHSYFAELDKNGGIMLGYNVVASNPGNKELPKSSMIPTDLSFLTSSYKGAVKKTVKEAVKLKAYTLNYLVMTRGRPMPIAKKSAFPWNWVEIDNLNTYSGSMSINRNAFAHFLANLFRPSLAELALQPVINFANAKKGQIITLKKAGTDPAYSLINGGPMVLELQYDTSDSNSGYIYHSLIYPSIKIIVDVHYSVSSSVGFAGDKIEIITGINVFYNITIINGGIKKKAYGKWIALSARNSYILAVDDDGGMKGVTSGVEINDNSEHPIFHEPLLPYTEDKFRDEFIIPMKKTIKTKISHLLVNEADGITDHLNGPRKWVFPGGQTFSYEDAQFSEHQDLITHILYTSS